ncbi:MAG: response regulator transcription factor [Synergistaceae bacterium]|nr:response regulator transcription factor [Synergistaceae bacterium]
MKLNIAIVDDRQEDIAALRLNIINWSCPDGVALGNILCCSSGEAVLPFFQPGEVQLFFLDILMEDIDGIETARRIRTADPGALIVFVTASREFAFDAFPVHPFDYIVKPYGKAQIDHVLNEAARVLTSAEPTVTIRVPHGSRTLPLRRVSAVLSQGHGVEFLLSDGQTVASLMSFAEAEELLGDHDRFLVCNRGLIVNMDRIVSSNGDAFKMRDGRLFPIRVRGRAGVLSAFSQYQMSRLRSMNKNGEGKE